MTEPTQPPLRVALLGAGIFATNGHIPTIQRHPEVFQCVAVWSRREESVNTLILKKFSKNDDATTPQAYSGDDGLKQVLENDNVEAVIISLPLDVQPNYVIMALQSGKHVLSEKPIAATVSEAKKFVDLYQQKYSSQLLVWSVAENKRYEPANLRAAEAVKNEIGNPYLFSLTIRNSFKPDNPYLNTPWRNKPSWYGGFFVDCLVHATATLRTILGGEAKTIAAFTSSGAEHIPSVDTMAASVEWESGIQGTISCSFACSYLKYELEIVGTEGSIMLQRKLDGPGYNLIVHNAAKEKREVEEFGFGGLDAEFLAFAEACGNSSNKECHRNTPEEAMMDLSLVEACLNSGKENGKQVVL